MRAPFAAFALIALLMQPACSAATRTLALPRPLQAGEVAWLEVNVGPLGRGEKIEITTRDGKPLGSITTFASRAGSEAGTFTIPLPPEVIANGHVEVNLSIRASGREPRDPSPDEVKSVTVKITKPVR